MKNLGPILTVLAVIVALWYAAAVWMNAAWTYDQAARAGGEVTFAQLLTDTMAQERPVLPPPHQVLAISKTGTPINKLTEKKSAEWML